MVIFGCSKFSSAVPEEDEKPTADITHLPPSWELSDDAGEHTFVGKRESSTSAFVLLQMRVCIAM